MATRQSIENSPRADDLGDKICDICGSNRCDAFWQGKRNIKVCGRCALEVLPKLIADTVQPYSFKWSTNIETQILANFRKGLVNSMLRVLQDHEITG